MVAVVAHDGAECGGSSGVVVVDDCGADAGFVVPVTVVAGFGGDCD